MRDDIKDILTKLSNGDNPFFEQDTLPKEKQLECKLILENEPDLKKLNAFFDNEISPIIFHSHNMYLANK